jgi:CRP-like cAMP-binding protein
MELRKLRDKATEAFTKGRFAKAAELYEEYCQKDPRDIQARLRMGDAWAKAGQRSKAIASYKSAAEAFAKEGFLPRAIAASKLILELDPAHQGVQQMLADLYARRSGSAPARAAPTPPAAAAGRREPIELPPLDPAAPAPPAVPDAVLAASDSAVVPRGATELPHELEITALPAGELPHELEVTELPAAELPHELEVLEPAGGPPGLRRRPEPAPLPEAAAHGLLPDEPLSSSEEMEVTIEMPEEPDQPSAPISTPPAASRIWIPGLEDSPPSAPAPAELAEAAPGRNLRDLERAFSRFDELSLDDAPPPPRAARLPSFADLELQGASLLHAVEVAAQAGQTQRGEVVAEVGDEEGEEEEVFSLTAEVGPMPEIPLFSDLPPDAFMELFDRCPLRRCADGERIIAQGSVGDAFYVVCEGAVRVVREQADGHTELAVLREGAFFGEMALLSGSSRTASVYSASDDTQVLEISAPVLAQLSHRFPSVAQALKKFCRQRLLSNVMSSSPLFQPFSRSDRRSLVQRFRARDVPTETVIIEEGDETDGLYVVLSGEVEVARGGQVVARLREGELFGEMSLLRKTPALASVKASRHTSLLRLPREDFDALVLSHPQILVLVADLTEDRQRQAEAVLAGAAQVSEEGLLLV